MQSSTKPTQKQPISNFRLVVFAFKSPNFYKEQVEPYRAKNDTEVAEFIAREQLKAQKANIPAPQPKPPMSQNIQSGDIWVQLAYCESGGRWDYNGSSGYDGGLQFSPSTWNSMNTGYQYAWQAPAEVQIEAGKRLVARSGWGQFPACARKLGLL